MSFNIDDLGGGGKAASFDKIGDRYEGRISLIEQRQQRSFDGGTPLTWDDGSPRMQLYVEIETDLRESDDDDGVRALYLKGGRNFEPAEGKGLSGEEAFKDAAKKAGLKTIETDGSVKLTIVHSGLAKPTTRGYQPAKLYAIKLEKVGGSVDVDDLFDE